MKTDCDSGDGKNGDSQRETLRQWLHLWQAEGEIEALPPDEKMRDDEAAAAPPEAAAIKLATTPSFDDGEFAPGEIRLFGPDIFPGQPRLFYAAILDEWPGGMRLIAPFASFPIPATNGEFLLDGRSEFLRVLSLWNTRSCPLGTLASSWLCDLLVEDELSNARAVLGHVAAARPLPDALLTRVGSPIIHPTDPRLEYQRREMTAWAPITRAAAELVDWLQMLSEVESEASLTLPRLLPIPAAHARRHLCEHAENLALAAADNSQISSATTYRGGLKSFLEALKGHDSGPDLGKVFEATLAFPPVPSTADPERAEAQWRLADVGESMDGAAFAVFDGSQGGLLGTGIVTASMANLTSGSWQNLRASLDAKSHLFLVVCIPDNPPRQA